nr:MAG TPA: hypothetical protein [Caudoviricetes sp.]
MKWQEDRKGDSGAVDDSPCHHNKRLSKRRRKSLIKKPENPVSESDRCPSSLGKFGVLLEGLLYSVK